MLEELLAGEVLEIGVVDPALARDQRTSRRPDERSCEAFADDPQHAFPGQGQMKPEQLEIARLKREVIKLKAERDILKNHRGLGPPVGRETAGGYLCRGRERPSAFWWRVTPLKNMVHGLLRA